MSVAAAAPWPPGIDLDLVRGAGPLGLAVSGGSDSTALAVLLAEAGLHDLTLLTVDHNLRPGSAADADFVEDLARRLGLPFERLVVTARPRGSVQAFARAARYGLLGDAALRRDLGAIVTAHTLDDQAETFLLRLARGSGVRGLGAMHAASMRDGLAILRPFLGARRADLRAALAARGVTWREDPSNDDPRFDRIAMRRLLPLLAPAGLTAERLAGTAHHLQRAGAALDAAIAATCAEAMRVDRAGGIRLARAPLMAASEEVRLRVLADAVVRAGGGLHPPRFDRLAAAATRVASGSGRLSLGRAVLDIGAQEVRLWREARGIETATLPPGGTLRWDGRFTLRAGSDIPPLRIAPLGALARHCPADALPGALTAAPAVFVGDRLVAAPTLGVRRRDFPRHGVAARALR